MKSPSKSFPRLSKSDEAIWRHVRQSVTPLRHQDLDHEFFAEAMEQITKGATQSRAILREGSHQDIKLDAIMPTGDLQGMMKSRKRAVKRGNVEPTARIDLHGLKLEDAHFRFRHFVIEHVKAHHKILLVITGKGGHKRHTEFGVETSGVIRRAFSSWMVEPEIARLISHYCPAHVKHGGQGAFYIFTRAKARR